MVLKNKVFYDLKKQVEKALLLEIKQMGPKTPLKDACEYALMNGGKRFRPLLVLLVAKAVNPLFNVMSAALACEFLHTSSLIADDLPSMDDEKKRRSKPALHLKFDEGIALLVSYSLISSGYELLYKNALSLEGLLSRERCLEICAKAIETVSLHAGIKGACGGQFLDLYCKKPTLDVINEIIYKKTISLFEIAFVLGFIYAGGDFEKIQDVKKAAFHFGMAFQIIDDILDFEEDTKKQKLINISIALGEKKAKELASKHLDLSIEMMKKISLYSDEIKKMIDFMRRKI